MTVVLMMLLAAAVVIGVVRLVVRWVRDPAERRAAPWRLAVLLAMQPLCAALLYMALMPVSRSTGTLVVVTRHGGGGGAGFTGDRLVALPEASVSGAERVPDLATAIRRHAPTRLKVVGDGLEPRDREAAQGLAVDFVPSAAPSGLVRLDLPGPVAAGAAFAVGGRVTGVARPAIDLVDPAGRRVDTAVPDTAGDFTVSATTRAAGPAAFTLRIRSGPRFVEEASVPEWTIAVPPQRLLLLAGAPGPEVKYLRRWATAGMVVHSQFATGGGLELGDPPLAIGEATLHGFDMAVLDARSWAALSQSERDATIAAVRAGLGLLIRIDGPLSNPERAALRPLGFAVTGGDSSTAVALPAPAVDAAAQLARDGPGSRDAPTVLNRETPTPLLTRWAVTVAAAATSPLARDARGAAIAQWRAEGAGRIGLWPIDDSFRLVLAGHRETHGELWRAAFATLGRGRPQPMPRIEQPAWTGQRVALCGLIADVTVIAPDGSVTSPIADRAAGCAAFWPRIPGWYQVREGGRAAAWHFAVAPAAALPSVRAQANRDATLRLAAVQPSGQPSIAGTRGADGPWPWAILWLAASAGLWWFERTRFGFAAR